MTKFIFYEEQPLLQQVAKGNEAAFRELLYRYADLLGAYLFRFTQSKELAEEMVQDVFLKIWMNREVLVEVRHFKTYLFVVSRNSALNALRKIIRNRNEEKEWQKNCRWTEPATGDNNDDNQLDLLELAINQLPPQQQKVWLLSRRQGKSHVQIAADMKLSKETVKKYIMYARDSITCFVKKHLETE